MRTSIVLIDYENVQPKDLSPLVENGFRVMLFVGASQTRLPFELVDSMQRLGDRAEYVKVSGAGRDALDFHICYYIGQLAAEDPDARFHVVSKDSGFDPLIAHLRTKKIRAARVRRLSSLLAASQTAKPSNAARNGEVKTVRDRLRKMKHAKPRSVKTLSSTIAAMLGDKRSNGQVAALVQALEKCGFLTITDKKISYPGTDGDGPKQKGA